MSVNIKVHPFRAITLLNRAVREGVALLNEARADYLRQLEENTWEVNKEISLGYSEAKWNHWALMVKSMLGSVYVQVDHRWQTFKDSPPKLKVTGRGIDPEYFDHARGIRRRLKVLMEYISEIERSAQVIQFQDLVR